MAKSASLLVREPDRLAFRGEGVAAGLRAAAGLAGLLDVRGFLHTAKVLFKMYICSGSWNLSSGSWASASTQRQASHTLCPAMVIRHPIRLHEASVCTCQLLGP